MCQATVIKNEMSKLNTSIVQGIEALIDNDVPYIKHGHYHYEFTLLDKSTLNIDLLSGLVIARSPYVLPELTNTYEDRERTYTINPNEFTLEHGQLN